MDSMFISFHAVFKRYMLLKLFQKGHNNIFKIQEDFSKLLECRLG